MAWQAYDMPGLTAAERTRRIELIQAMLVYNILGESLYLPGGGGGGVRSKKFGGLAAQNLLAMVANADARDKFRERYPEDYKEMCELVLSQTHVELCAPRHLNILPPI